MQRYKCVRCNKTYSDKHPLDTLRLDFKKACEVVHLLCEGMGIRAVSRFTGLNQETVLNVLELAGQKALRLLDEQIKNVEVESVQCDELFAFVHSKEANNKTKDVELRSQRLHAHKPWIEGSQGEACF